MNLTDLARVRDEDLAADPAGRPSGAGAQALLAAITAEPVKRQSAVRRRVAWGAGALGLAASIVLATGLPFGEPTTRYANAAIAVSRYEGQITIEIKDPLARPEEFREAFAAIGLNAEVKQIPVVKEQVGALMGPGTPDTGHFEGWFSQEPIEPCAATTCVKMSVPKNFPGRMIFGVGREARPGEPYTFTHWYLSPAMKDVKVEGRPVAEVRAEVERRGFKVGYQLRWHTEKNAYIQQRATADQVEDNWKVETVQDYSSDMLDIVVVPGPEAWPAPSPTPSPKWWEKD
ncbi:hypothetical protein ACFXJ8_00105 [Nonomuraea sp. NPDC059194]|uniref:hypothetical protein n=1 Tax=Nonomuraea sp. NPDC059194 TaxID=3346764 RepID=UPI0036A42377